MRFSDRVGAAIATAHDMVDRAGALAATTHYTDAFVDRKALSIAANIRLAVGIRRPHPVLVAKVDPPMGDSVAFGGANSFTSLKTSSFLKSSIFVALTIFNELDPMKRALDDARFNQASHS
jgi:hypothetical protein